jgi:hypothetical protein
VVCVRGTEERNSCEWRVAITTCTLEHTQVTAMYTSGNMMKVSLAVWVCGNKFLATTYSGLPHKFAP